MGIPSHSNPPPAPYRFLSGFESDTRGLIFAHACLHGSKETLASLIENKNIWPNICSKSGETLLMALLRSDKSSVPDWHDKLRLLLAHPLTGVNLQCDEGNTPLHIAAARGDVEVIDILLKHKADKSLRNVDGKTPADVATTDVLQEKLSVRRRPTRRQDEPSTTAAIENISIPDVPEPSEVIQPVDQQSVLTRDDAVGDLELYSTLHQQCRDNGILDAKKMTEWLIHALSCGDYPRSVRFLIQYGADVTIQMPCGTKKTASAVELALDKERVKSFREICLWTSDWHRSSRFTQLTFAVRRRQTALDDTYPLSDIPVLHWKSVKERREILDARKQKAEEFKSWTEDGLAYATARLYCADKRNFQEGFAKIARQYAPDYHTLAALYAEFGTTRRSWIGRKKNYTAYETDVCNMMLHALMQNDFSLADDVARYKVDFCPSESVRYQFNQKASKDAHRWLLEYKAGAGSPKKSGGRGGFLP